MPFSFTSTPQWLQTPSVSPGVQDIGNGNPGPYEWSGKLFWIYDEIVTGSPDTIQLVAYRSDDHGQSQPMTRIASGSPIANNGGSTAVGSPGTGSVIPISFQVVISGSIHIKATTFDMATQTFGAILDTGVSFSAFDNSGITIPILRANGDLVVAYDDNGTVFAVIYHSGSWSGPITIGTGTHPFPLIGGDPIGSGNVGIWWSDGTDIQFCVLSGSTPTSTVATTQADIITNQPTGTQQLPFATIYDSVHDAAAWIFLKNLQHPDMGVYVVVMSPASSPSSTLTLVYRDVADSVEFLNPTLAGNPAGNVFVTLLWSVTQDRQLQILQGTSLLSGPWTGPDLYYNAVANPPSPAPSSLHNVFPSFSRFLADGSFVNTSNFFPPSAGTSDAVDTPAAMIPPTAVPTLQLGKTVVGGTALPTDFIVTATGPDTISGAGGVGPATVTAGTYALSETGPVNYTAVWNCGAATMPTATSVVVPSDGTPVVCTLTNTFNPVPPPPPTPPDAVLRYQIPQRRWFPHAYADHIVTHYLDEAEVDKPNDMQLLMLSGTHIMKSGGNTDNGADVTALVYLPSNDGGDERAQKLYVDTMVEADQTGDIISQVRFNNGQQIGPGVVMSPTGLREQFLENISSLADLSLYRNIMAVLSWTGGPDGPRIYAFEPSGFAQPYVSTFFVTQFINLAYPGWKSGRRFYPAIISNFPVLLTIKTQDDRVYGPYSIPSTGGQFRIIPMILNHGVKDLAFAFQLDGRGHPFALFPGEFTVELKGWSDPDYIDLAIFRT